MEYQLCESNKISFLKHCTPDQAEVVEQSKTCATYKKGDFIFNESAIPLGVYCILSGVIKLVRTNLDGKEQILRFAQPGDVLGYRALIADEPLVSSAVCLEDAVACFIPKSVFLNIVDENSAISKDLMKALSHELGVVEERVQSLAQKSVRERLAETLLFLHATFKSNNLGEDVIAITLPREDIANIVGTATETVIRLLSEFKSDKLIELEGKKIKLLEKAKLEKISHASV
ncbi:MAG: Crp/Fnr family transcriptional regulator [Bacteroidetes bacterium]|nr:MAG: Crp/Fnr family transcriptional regulator [Bacteroidota bacterium]